MRAKRLSRAKVATKAAAKPSKNRAGPTKGGARNPPGVGRMVDGKRHGPWKFYHREGKLWSTGTFDHGIGHGMFKWYAANGKLRQAGRLEHGIQTGLWRRFRGGTGQLYDVGKWEAGKRVGVWKTYNKDGSLKHSATF